MINVMMPVMVANIHSHDTLSSTLVQFVMLIESTQTARAPSGNITGRVCISDNRVTVSCGCLCGERGGGGRKAVAVVARARKRVIMIS